MLKDKQRMLLGLLLVALLLFLLRMAWPFASAFVIASTLAIVIWPLNERLRRFLRRPALASLITTVATLAVTGTIFTFVCVTVVKDTTKAYNSLNQHSAGAGHEVGITRTIDLTVDAVATRLPLPKETIRAEVLAGMKAGVVFLAGKVHTLIGSMASLIFTNVMASFFLYYLLLYGEHWVRRAIPLVPLNPQATTRLLRAGHHSIVASVNGVIVVGVAQGLFLSLGFWFLGFGSPLLWGMFGAAASVIPFVGATLIWIPVVIGFVLAGEYGKALELGLWGGVVVGSLDNFLRPLIVGVRENQNPVLIGFSMLGATYAIGPLGILLGPLVVSLTKAAIEEIRNAPALAEAASFHLIEDEVGELESRQL